MLLSYLQQTYPETNSSSFFFNPDRSHILDHNFHLHDMVSWLFYLLSGINWKLVPGTVDAFSNLIVRLLLASPTSSFSIRMNLIPSIADLQYSKFLWKGFVWHLVFVDFILLLSFWLFHLCHHMVFFAMTSCKEVPLCIKSKIFLMAAQIGKVLISFVLCYTTISKIFNIFYIWQISLDHLRSFSIPYKQMPYHAIGHSK